MKHTKTIKIHKESALRIKAFLENEPKDESECQGEDETIAYTAVFDDGREMDIKVCGVQYDEDSDTNTSWTEAVLFDAKGSQLCCSDVCDDFFREWELEYGDDTYIVMVEMEEAE